MRPTTPAPQLDQGHFLAVTAPASLTPPPSHDVPTEAYTPPPSYELPTEAYTPPAPVFPPPVDETLVGTSAALAAQPVGFDGLGGPETNALDSLFGDENFVEYDPGVDLAESPFQRPSAEIAAAPKPPRAPLTRTQKTLIGVAGGLVAALALVALYVAGTRMTPAVAEPPVPAPVETEEAAPAEELLGPVAPGVYSWDALLGTECLEPFDSIWDSEFTVVDCGVEHSAQLVYRGRFDDEEVAPYPGAEELVARTNVACASTENIDYTAAAAYSDVRISASFAASEADWAAGQRDYFCFVTREDAAPLTSTIAMPDRLITAAPSDAAGE